MLQQMMNIADIPACKGKDICKSCCVTHYLMKVIVVARPLTETMPVGWMSTCSAQTIGVKNQTSPKPHVP